MARITIRVQPRASASEVAGYGADGALKVRVTAPPVEGAANEAVIRTLSGALGVPKSSISILRGDTGRVKVIEIAGLDEAEVRTRATQALRPARKGQGPRSSG